MSRFVARALIAALFVLPACGNDGTNDDPASTVSQSLDKNDQACDGATDVIDAHHAAFNAKNAGAFGATFTDDARHTGPHSITNVGGAKLAQVHGFLFSPQGPFTTAKSTATTKSVLCLRGGTAIVDQLVDLTGHKGLSPGNVNTFPNASPPIFRTVQRFVVVKEQGEWKIQSLQLTAIPPAFAGAPFPGE